MIGALVNISIILLVLGVLIALHELGHFLASKLCKVQVDEFAIGMGPAIFKKKFRGTLYALRVLPIGGYVKILGEGDDPDVDLNELKSNPANFQNKSPLQKIFILSAGVLMNLLTAVTIYYGFLIYSNFTFPLPEIKDYTPVFGSVEREVLDSKIEYELGETGGARDAGWPEKGTIVGVGSESVRPTDDEIGLVTHDVLAIRPIRYSDQVTRAIKSSKGESLYFYICTSSATNSDVEGVGGDEISTAPISNDIGFTFSDPNCNVYATKISDAGLVGIYLPPNFIDVIEYNGLSKLFAGFTHSANIVHMGFVHIGNVFGEANESGDYETAVNTVSSPIGLYFIIEVLKSYGILGILDLVANLSVTLFVMNLLPIPALDGGRIVLVTLEAILGNRFNKNIEAWAIRLSFLFLLIFMLLIMVKDIFYWDSLKNIL